MQLIKRVSQFIQARWDGKSPLLLGYSGGPDSKALLYALLEAGVKSIHLAHIDHGWREESGREAKELEREALGLNLPFHLHRLTEKPIVNFEEAGRVGRIQFFRSLFAQIPFQALLLAHHRDDLAENAIKRTFEGARLCNLGGMAPHSLLEGMLVWRPLLSTPKSDLWQFLAMREIVPIVDLSNEDPRYLRARLRKDIVPLLEASFGKNISANLQVLAERSHELKHYLDEQIQSISPTRGPWGKWVDLSGIARILQRHWLQSEIEGLGREAMEIALDALAQGSLMRLSDAITIERGGVFFFSSKFPQFEQKIPMAPGPFSSGDWDVVIEPLSESLPRIGWKEIWTGQFTMGLPEGNLEIVQNVSKYRERARQLRMPTCFRGILPMIVQEDVAEILNDCKSALRWKASFTIHIKS